MQIPSETTLFADISKLKHCLTCFSLILLVLSGFRVLISIKNSSVMLSWELCHIRKKSRESLTRYNIISLHAHNKLYNYEIFI